MKHAPSKPLPPVVAGFTTGFTAGLLTNFRASLGAACYGLGLALAATACAGSSNEPNIPEAVPAGEEAPDDSWQTDDDQSGASAPAEQTASKPTEDPNKKPEFTEGMTVEQAISAVPSHYEYVGLDQEVLGKPLTQIETYKECNVKPSDKFTVRIAVWDGKVVGADVKSHNKALAECIDGVVRKLEYKDRVESINTVEFSF